MQLHKKTQIEVQKILDETGHALTLDDVADIVAINAIANRITSTTGAFSELYKWPTLCGNLLLRPLSLGKIAWYKTRACQWFEDDNETLSTVLAFLMSVDNDESFVASLGDPQAAKSAIEEWEIGVSATPAQLSSAVKSMMPDNIEGGAADGCDDTIDDGPLIALLCREYGESPQHWLFVENIFTIRSLVDSYVARINNEMRAMGKHSKRATAMAPIRTPSMSASLEFRKKLEELKMKWICSNGC